MLIAGSTNQLHYTPLVAGVATEPDSVSVAVADATGAAVSLGAVPVWNAATKRLDLTIEHDEVPTSAIGTDWTIVWTWTYGGATLRDPRTEQVVGVSRDGALVTLSLAKQYLHVPASDTTYDELIGSLIVGVEALMAIEAGTCFASRTITAEPVVVGPRDHALRLKNWPIASVTTVVDPGGAEWDADAFTICGVQLLQASQGGAALRYGAGGYSTDAAGRVGTLESGTWAVTYVAGLENLPNWLTEVKPALAKAALDEVSDAYNIRTARATSESGGDQSHSLAQDEALSDRTARLCRKWRVWP